MGRHALLIATGRYADSRLQQLRAPVSEAQRLRALLLDPAIGRFDTATVAVDESKGELDRSIERLFLGRTPDDLVLLYLSGHGLKNDYDKLFFAATNTDLQLPVSTAVSASAVHDLIQESQARVKCVLLDCCYSGAFTKGLTAKSATRTRIAEPLAGRGTYVITATDELEYAWENGVRTAEPADGPVRSVFTAAVIEALETGAADKDGDGRITGDDLYQYVYKRTTQAGQRQTPTRYDRIKGDFEVAWARESVVPQPETVTLGDVLEPEGEPLDALTAPLGRLPDGSPARLDLSGESSHLLVVGRLFTGKSALLLSIVLGLALRHGPGEARLFCLDSDERLGLLESLPHVDAVLGEDQVGDISAVFNHLRGVVATRRQLFRDERIGSVREFRARRAAGDLPPGEHADMFLVVDGWNRFAAQNEDFAAAVHQLADRGLNFGVHVVVTAKHRDEVPREIRQLLRGRIELALDDPAESMVDPQLSARLPDGPGWGLWQGQVVRLARPVLDETGTTQDLVQSLGSGPDPEPSGFAAFRSGAPISMLHLLGIDDPAELDLDTAWRSRPIEQRLRIPLGISDTGDPVELDLKEAALGGMGPHGLCVGATGSGKSELLRTVLFGLLATHPPTQLNLILVDFKGGATFRGLTGAPHVSAMLTDLDGGLAGRIRDAIAGEVARRQQLLAGGRFQSIWDYERAREGGADLDPLPALLLCVDEFSQLITGQPEFIDILAMIGRVGRSLGMHLLLATQRLDEPTLRGIGSFLSYRIGLRMFSDADSRAVLGVPLAYELPPIPGSGYVRADSSREWTRFRTAYVSGPHGADDARRTVFDALLGRVAGQAEQARQVWLAPMAASPSVDALLPRLAASADRGLTSDWPGNGRLRVPIGLVDRPYDQRRDAYTADFSGSAGHALVVGSPQSGKSTMLRTIVLSTALTHTPLEVQFYGIDLGGGQLDALRRLPHVGGVAGRSDRDQVQRTIQRLTALLHEREQRFRRAGIDSMAEFRVRKRAGRLAEEPYGDVFLVIDGWATFRQEFEELEPDVENLAARGLSYGVHLIVSANRWLEVARLKDFAGTRIELRLGDPYESVFDQRAAAKLPPGRPGLGLTPDQLQFQGALPRIDGPDYRGDHGSALAAALEQISATWQGSSVPRVRILPDRISYTELTGRAAGGDPGDRRIPVGVDEDSPQPVRLNFDAEPHFLAFADGESGKTNLLRIIVRGIIDRYTSKEAVILLVDYRRTMLGFIDNDHLLGYAVSGNQLTGMVSDVHTALRNRLPGPDVTQEQLRDRSWWQGPELFIVVDDYDLVSPRGGENPLGPMAELLPQAKDVGLHLVIARRSGGAGRSLYDLVLSKLIELGSPGLVMSGSANEGMLLGKVKPSFLPPGRGTLVDRWSAERRIQVAQLDP